MSATRTCEAVWARLRATRSNPPVAAASNAERRDTYDFALEQAEQMFRAASGVGTATRPLQVFYGLSQAGRAIAAAAPSQNGDEWRLGGHGITAVDLWVLLPDIEVYAHGKGSFVRLSKVLDSPVFAKARPVALTQLWDSVPENRLWPLRDGQHRRIPLQVTPQNRYRPHPYVIEVISAR